MTAFSDFLTALSLFHFLRPAWLWALLPLALCIGWLWRHPSISAWTPVCDPHLLRFLQPTTPPPRAWLGVLAAGWLIALIALAGPTWRQHPQAVLPSPHAVVIVLDLSPSMQAADVAPSRLARARFKVTDLLTHVQDAQVALVAFADDAFVITPLTTDHHTVLNLLTNLSPAIMPVAGSRTDRALDQARTLLMQTGFERGLVVLVTDDEPDERTFQAARRLRATGSVLSVLAVGTPEGAPIPVAEGGFAKDHDGHLIIARVDLKKLQQLAQQGGGRLSGLQPDDRDLQHVVIFPMQTHPQSPTADQEALQWQDYGPWWVVLLLPLAALAFRRGVWLLCIGIIGLWLPPPIALAWSWTDAWQRRDQQAAAAFAAHDFQRAAELADDPLQRGNALYRAGKYEQALEAFNQVQGATGSYNRANAYAKLQRFQEALTAYEQAVAQNPQLEDARHNRDKLAAWLRQLSAQQRAAQPSAQQAEQPSSDSSPSNPAKSQPPPTDQPSSSGSSAHPPDAPKELSPEPTSPADDADQTAASSPPWSDHSQNQRNQKDKPLDASPETASPKSSPPADPTDPSATDPTTQEQQQALEHWLQRIPDDPGGLLRRKLHHQAQQRMTLPDPKKRY